MILLCGVVGESRTLLDGRAKVGSRDRAKESLDSGRLGGGDLLRDRSDGNGREGDTGLDRLVGVVVSLADGVTEDLSDIGHGDKERGLAGVFAKVGEA